SKNAAMVPPATAKTSLSSLASEPEMTVGEVQLMPKFVDLTSSICAWGKPCMNDSQSVRPSTGSTTSQGSNCPPFTAPGATVIGLDQLVPPSLDCWNSRC